MAILLLDERAGLREFTDEVVRRPDVQAMIERIDSWWTTGPKRPATTR